MTMQLTKAELRRQRRRERTLKAVAVLPSLATLGNLVCGFAAIYLCLLSADWRGGDLARPTLGSARIDHVLPTYLAIGAYLIFAAMCFDALDGRLARWTRKTSDFGAQLDSLCDVVSFGLAPAILALCVSRQPYGGADMSGVEKLWWRVELVMFAIYVCCAAIRLARFNVENVADESAHKYFRGLPSPGAAAAVCSIVILHEEFLREALPSAASAVQHAAPPFALAAGLLMVSRHKYPHLVNTVLRRRRPLSQILLMVSLLLLCAVAYPHATFAALACGYACVGPVTTVLHAKHTVGAAPPSGESPRNGRLPPADSA